MKGLRPKIVFYSCLFFFFSHPANSNAAWRTETLDNLGDMGQYSTIAIDSNGKIHISYYDATNLDLKYIANSSDSWILTTIDSGGDVGQFSSIALDSNNKVHISYYDATNNDLKYATNVSGAWVASIIDSTGDVGQYTAITVDSINKIHISYGYYDSNSSSYGIKYATNTLGLWTISNIDQGSQGPVDTSIGVGSNNKVHISYNVMAYGDYLQYATNTSGSWITSSIETNCAVGCGVQEGFFQPSIAIDSNDNVHISYLNGLTLKYATNVTGSWATSWVEGSALFPCIALDTNSTVHIAYYDINNNDLKYSTNATGTWVASTIDSTDDVGRYASIAIDSNGNAHISYYDLTNGNLKYATNAPDTTAPTTTASPAGGIYTSAQSVTLTCSDGTGSGCDKIFYTTDGTTPTTASTVYSGPISISTDTTLKFFAQDLAGNSEAVKTEVYTIDAAAPNGMVSINSAAAYANTTSATLTLTCADASGCMEMILSNDGVFDTEIAEAYAATKAWTLSTGDGTKTVYVKFKDGAGNVSNVVVSDSILLDKTAPDTSIMAQPSTPSNSTSASFSFTSTETGSTFECQLDSGGYSSCTSPMSYTGLTAGSHTFYVKATDPAGNTDSTPASFTWTIDTTAPAFSSTSPQSDSFITTATVGYSLSKAVSSGKSTFTRTGGSADSSVHVYNFTASDITVGSHSINTGLSLVSGAIYTVTFEATDAAGNTGSVSSTNVTYDTSSASVTISSPAANSVTNNAKVSYTLSEDISAGNIVFTRTGGTSDSMSPYTYTLSASERTAGSHTADTGKVLMDGAIYTVSFENVKDMAGNSTATVSNTNVKYDISAVAITNTSPAANSIITNSTVGYVLSEQASSGKITFTRTGGVADANSPHVYELTASDLTSGSHTVNTNITLVDGVFYTVSFDAADLVGNASTTVSNAMIFYDSNYGIGPTGNVDNTSYSVKRVDGYDLIKLSIAFGSKPGDANWNPLCDLDGNSKVDGSDLIVLGNHFGEVGQ